MLSLIRRSLSTCPPLYAMMWRCGVLCCSYKLRISVSSSWGGLAFSCGLALYGNLCILSITNAAVFLSWNGRSLNEPKVWYDFDPTLWLVQSQKPISLTWNPPLLFIWNPSRSITRHMCSIFLFFWLFLTDDLISCLKRAYNTCETSKILWLIPISFEFYRVKLLHQHDKKRIEENKIKSLKRYLKKKQKATLLASHPLKENKIKNLRRY